MALKPCDPAGQVIETPPMVTANGAGADQIARRPSPQQEADRLDQDGLAGSRLSRQDVEAGAELELDRVDDCEPFDGEEPEHGKRGNSNPSIGLTAISLP